MKYGIAKGSLKGIYRVLRCNPFAEGGYDPP
jgi:putative component of membrane protein insertase Oxa1/YidC/SpoIIIJ protein YidD